MSFFFYLVSLNAGKRDLIILLDWDNERIDHALYGMQPSQDSDHSPDFGPISSSLLTTLEQKAAPILVSAATWKNFIQRKQIYGDFITLDTKTLITKYKRKFTRFNTDEGIITFAEKCKAYINPSQFGTLTKADKDELCYFLLSYVLMFDPKEWYMEKFGNYVYLLIPKIYQENQRIKNDYPKVSTKLSNRELILGLKHGISVSDPFDIASFSTPSILNYGEEFLKILSKIFVTKADVPDDTQCLHHWYMYVIGHGSPAEGFSYGSIVGLSLLQFSRFLFFLNTTIQTDFLIYVTCFAGGQHLVQPYERTWFYPPKITGGPVRQAITPEVFNYIIIANTLAYAPSYEWSPHVPEPFMLGISKVIFKQQFPSFFTSIKKYFYPEEKIEAPLNGAPLNLVEILKNVQAIVPQKKGHEKDLQIPVIRYPGTEWFSIIDFHHEVFRLSRVLVETHQAEKREIVIARKKVVVIDLPPFLGRRMAVPTRMHSEILVPVRIRKNGMDLPSIVSSAIAPADYYFDTMIVPQGGLINYMNSFFSVPHEWYGRTYYFKKLICLNDLTNYTELLGTHYGEPLELSDVIIVVNDINPLLPYSTKKYNGIIMRYQLQNFVSLWSVDDTASNEKFFKKKTLPWLFTIRSIPAYPFKLPETKYTKVIQALEKKQKHGPAWIPSATIDVSILQKELKNLSDKLAMLNKNLAALSATK